jgi:thioesterase domain-containing protein/acyl carrier protein/NRPS condensation-like uncharacterized protein
LVKPEDKLSHFSLLFYLAFNMELPISEQSHLSPSLQPESEKTPSDFWKAVRTNIKLQHQAPPIKPVPRSGDLPVSFAQERLWFLDQLQPGSSIHNMRFAFRLKGLLNVAVLEKSIKEIVLRHEILRTTFPSVDGQPVQSISPEIDLKLPVVDLRKLPETEREVEAQRLAIEEAEQPFDLTQGSLMRVKLLRLAEEEYWLLRTVHHIVFDGWSYRIFMRELAILYEAFSTGNPSPLPELPIQYADFAQSQRQSLQGEVLKSHLDYWQQQLSDNIPALELPIDRSRPTVPTYQGTSQSLVLSEHLTEALKALSHQEGVSLFVTLLAAFKTLLYRYTAQENLLICSPVAGRHRVETKRLIGYFNNIVALRTDLSGNPNFRELLRRVSQTTLGAFDHQDLPFQKLAEFPNLARIPLNRAMFALQNTLSQPLSLANIAVSSLNLNWEAANFDFSLFMNEHQGKLTGLLQYKTTLFDATTITQMLEHFQTLLETIVTNPHQCLEDLPLLISNGKIGKSALPAPDRLRQESASTFVPPSNDLEIQLTKIWENVLGKKPIGVKDNFFDLGGHSLLALRLLAQIEKTFGKNLPLTTLFQAPNIEELANILRQKGWSAPWQTLVTIQPGGSKPPLFCIHPIGDNVLCYHTLAHYLGEQQPVYGLQAVGLDGKQAPYKRVEDMGAHYIREIRASQPEGPYLLAGYSSAGMVAFEMAQQLVAQGQKVAVLALLDASSPQLSVHELPLGRTLYINLRNLFRLRPKDKLAYIKQRAVWLHGRITRKIAEIFNLCMGHPPTEDSHPYALVTETFHQAMRDYVPQVYPGQATLFRTRHQLTGVYYDPQFGWESLVVGGLEIHDVPGLHLTLLTEPCVQVLAEKLRACIDEALEDVLEDPSSEPRKSTMEAEHQTNFLNQERRSALLSSLVPIQPHGLKLPLFCVHVLGRGLEFYRPLAHHFALEQPLYGLAAQMLDKKYAPPNRVEDLAAHYIKEMRIIQPDGPYFLAGVSFGGLVAFEIAQQLVAQGQQVALLALLDTYAPGAVKQLSVRERISVHWNNFLQLGFTYILEKTIENVKGKIQRFNNQLNYSLKGMGSKLYLSVGQSLPDNLQDFTFEQENHEAASNYVPQAYPGRVSLFRAMDEIAGASSYRDSLLGWGELAAGGLEIHEVPSTHLGMLQEPHVQVLAEKLKACIDRVQADDLTHIPSLCSDPFVCDNEDAEG